MGVTLLLSLAILAYSALREPLEASEADLDVGLRAPARRKGSRRASTAGRRAGDGRWGPRAGGGHGAEAPRAAVEAVWGIRPPGIDLAGGPHILRWSGLVLCSPLTSLVTRCTILLAEPAAGRRRRGDAWDPAKANVVDSTSLEPVGSYPEGASWVGAVDMAGNAMEWVADWYSGSYYKQEVRDDPTGPDLGTKKVEKGGWWGAVPYVARSAYRHFEDPPTYQDHHIGVRVVSAGQPPD